MRGIAIALVGVLVGCGGGKSDNGTADEPAGPPAAEPAPEPSTGTSTSTSTTTTTTPNPTPNPTPTPEPQPEPQPEPLPQPDPEPDHGYVTSTEEKCAQDWQTFATKYARGLVKTYETVVTTEAVSRTELTRVSTETVMLVIEPVGED